MKPRILVPFDFSPTAESALLWAADLHRSLGGELKLVHVLPTVPMGVSVAGELPMPAPSEVDVAKLDDELQKVAERFVPGAATEVLFAANPSEGVLHAADTWIPDLIVIGTHGRGGVKRLLLGSVADVLVRTATCPVVTVRGTV